MEKSTVTKDMEKALHKPNSYHHALMNLLNEIKEEATGSKPKPKPQPKNHLKENMKRLKEIEDNLKQKQVLYLPHKPVKCDRYGHVQSKLFSSNMIKCFDDDASKNYSEKQINSSASLCNQNPMPKMHHPLGYIPSYLLERKKLIAEEEKKRVEKAQALNVPPGHVLLSDEERKEALDIMLQNKAVLLSALASIPVRNDTLTLQNYTARLEKQLQKLEEGIEAFSRKRVLIKND